jgi:tetratricopeptide (TPR) repeat protein
VAVLLLYYRIKIILNADCNVNLNNRIIKITSVVGGIFFVFLPSLLLFTNPKADATEIKSRQNLAKEINKFDLVTRHNMVFADIDRIYHAIAISYNNSHQLEKSEKYVNKAISLKRDNNEAKFLLATLFHRTGRIPNAIKTYGEVLKMDPNHALSYKNLGIIYIGRKNYENATFYLRKFIALSPDQEEAAMLKSIIDRFPIKQN